MGVILSAAKDLRSLFSAVQHWRSYRTRSTAVGTARRWLSRVVTSLLLAALLGWPSALAQNKPNDLQPFHFEHPAMGTGFTLFLYSASESEADTIADEVFEEIDRIDGLLSNYKPASELSRINANAASEPVTTDPETFGFLQQSLYWSAASNGAFDITVGKLMKSWGFFRHGGRIPRQDELAALREETGWQKLKLDPANRTVRFTASGLELDPGGIGKGFTVDAAVRLLREGNITAALLSAGSSTVYGLGAPPGKPGWPVSVAGPLPSTKVISTVYLRDTSLSSADCTQKNFTLNGHLYCHIMDPRTGRPVEGRLQVSVIHPSATASDALSNVLFVDDPAQSFAVLRAHAPQARALVLSEQGGRVTCALFRWRGPVAFHGCRRVK